MVLIKNYVVLTSTLYILVTENAVEWWPVSEVRATVTNAIRAMCAGVAAIRGPTGIVARRNVAALQRRLMTLAHTHATPPPTAFSGAYHTALALLRGKYSCSARFWSIVW